jgi:hypothetical protein
LGGMGVHGAVGHEAEHGPGAPGEVITQKRKKPAWRGPAILWLQDQVWRRNQMKSAPNPCVPGIDLKKPFASP